MNFNKLTKKELIDKINELEVDIEDYVIKNDQLQNDVDYWIKEYNDLENINDELNEQINNQEDSCYIKDLDNFIWKLKLDNLYTKEIEEFINQYMRYYNDKE